MGADLARLVGSVPESMMVLRLRILADAHAGLLYTTPALDVGHVPPSERAAYFGAFRDMCRDGWLMEDASDAAGFRPVILTSIGEFVHRHANPGRYRSASAVEVRDGRVAATAVTR